MADNYWDNLVNPYTGAPAGNAEPQPARGGWRSDDRDLINPYAERLDPTPYPSNPYARPAPPMPAADAEAYSRGVTAGEEREDAQMLRKMRTDLAIRDIVGSKKSGAAAAEERAAKTAKIAKEAEEDEHDKRLRLYRELHELDNGTAKMAKDLGQPTPAEAAKGLREIDRGTEKLGRDMDRMTREREAMERAMKARASIGVGMPPPANAYGPPGRGTY